ncbi:MAG: tRNA (5-methylaminomethyl-2-thiouridine)(34)-methyltransferase MnmD [Bacteroidales bacterium]|nr:tRNA (5-methylaminomethyl-2-thiouridine)(34)-methyltransferase MnmD [Bacteroidales bacterium]
MLEEKRIIQKTLDGSTTLYVYELDEHYHSTNGAIQEAQHIYIDKAYNFSAVQTPVVFEVGFGTGLNTLMTAIEAEKLKRVTRYISIEKYPLLSDEVSQLNYTSFFGKQSEQLFSDIHACEWNKECKISEYFYLTKMQADLTNLPEIPFVDVVYFDAFAPNKQESMWSEEIFKHLFSHMNVGGIMTTYCAQGKVRRMLQSVGFTVERTYGPIGKREMLRATRIL